MRKLFILISCLYSAFLFGQTNVSGLINSNTTWDLSGSPYIVTGNLAVNAGVTLTIEAGVHIKLNSGKSILMNGELIAIGTADNEILFTSNAASPEKGDWGTLVCSVNATPAVYDGDGNYLAGSILQHVIIEYGGGNNADGQLVVDGAPFMDHIVSRYSSTRGVYAENLQGDIRLMNSEIHSNETDGVNFNSYSYEKYVIENNIHSNKVGLYLTGNSTVRGNYIYNNHSTDDYFMYISSESTNCFFVLATISSILAG